MKLGLTLALTFSLFCFYCSELPSTYWSSHTSRKDYSWNYLAIRIFIPKKKKKWLLLFSYTRSHLCSFKVHRAISNREEKRSRRTPQQRRLGYQCGVGGPCAWTCKGTSTKYVCVCMWCLQLFVWMPTSRPTPARLCMHVHCTCVHARIRIWTISWSTGKTC